MLWDNWGDERGYDEGHWHAHTRGLPWGLPEVVWTVQVHCSRRWLLWRGLEFHVCTINKRAHTKKSLETYRMHLVHLHCQKQYWILSESAYWDKKSKLLFHMMPFLPFNFLFSIYTYCTYLCIRHYFSCFFSPKFRGAYYTWEVNIKFFSSTTCITIFETAWP